jgi:hypothetical protein
MVNKMITYETKTKVQTLTEFNPITKAWEQKEVVNTYEIKYNDGYQVSSREVL